MTQNSSGNNRPQGEDKAYNAQSIKVIEGLEAVRKRPAMYIGSTGAQGLHHLVYEIVDNSVDEALAGFCSSVIITLHTDGSCSVEDNGRGIPTGIHPTEKISAAEVVLTKLHAGGKFDKDTYKFSGGLHGVGASVVNALSEWLKVTIHQNGSVFEQDYVRGKPQGRLKEIGSTEKRGTLMRFKPDAEIFQETTDLSFDVLSARMRELAFLNKGLRISIFDERSAKSHEFFFEGGIVSFVEHVNSKKSPLFPEVIHCQREDDLHIFEVALQYNDGYGEQLYSFVNNINTIDGGTHVTGFKAALTKACNKRGQEYGVIKADDPFSSEDVREGLVCVINMKVAEPQFEGQTKTKLGNSDVKGLVESWAFSCFDTFFEENPNVARKIIQKAEIARRARDAAKKARELTRRKSVLESTILPGKLADCSNENPVLTELFIVEGDSAGGSAKQGRERDTQAILPLRGKIINVEKARFDKILANEEIKALIAAIGAGVSNDDFNPEKVRYHKIIIMTDADVDGAHIRTLLLTFFFRYMKPLIDKGYLYVAQPPLYKAKLGKREQYLKDEKAFKAFLFEWAREQTILTLNNAPLAPDSWLSTVARLAQYDELLDDAGHKFRLTSEQIHSLVDATFMRPWVVSDGVEKLLEIMSDAMPGYRFGVVHQEFAANTDTLAAGHKTFITAQYKNRMWTVSFDFFSSPDYAALLGLRAALAPVETDWTLKMLDRERNISGAGIMALIRGVSQLSKPYMTVQRYKGLGEMNPEQLWETSMDPHQRRLLQVSIGDAIEADAWFDTLMGDDVAGRRTFIEENGHFVKNLDV